MKKNLKPTILKELEENFGVIQIACKKVGVVRDTFYRWCEEDPKFKAGVEKATESGKVKRLEIALAHHIRKLGDGEDRAVYFELTRRHPDYVQILKAIVEGKMEINQQIRTDPILKKAVKFYEDNLKKEYRRRDNSGKHSGMDKKQGDKKRKKRTN